MRITLRNLFRKPVTVHYPDKQRAYLRNNYETLKKIVANTSKANTPTTSSTSLGDPDCPHCGGLGYLRADVPVDHPSFGRLHICVCRQRDVSEQVRNRLYSLSRLEELKGLTFETFQPRGQKGLGEMQAGSLEMAFNQARHFAQNLNGWLLLQGGYGCGKTHLAAAIANFAVEMGVPTLFLTVPRRILVCFVSAIRLGPSWPKPRAASWSVQRPSWMQLTKRDTGGQ